MKLLHTFRCDLNKTICNLGFLGTVFMVGVLCFTAVAYTDLSIGRTYSVFEAIFTMDRGLIAADCEFSSLRLFSSAFSGYIEMFLPIIAVFPFLVSFCAERNSGLMRFTISRTGKMRYCVSKFMASVISGGLATLLGVLLYGIIVWIIFPDLGSYQLTEETLQEMYPLGVGVAVGKIMLAAFLYGAVSTIPAFFISSFCRNQYLIACIPFLFVYIWQTALNKLIAKGMEAMDGSSIDKIGVFYPDGLASIVRWNQWNVRVTETLVFNLVYFLVGVIGFMIIMNCRTDKGV